MIAEAFPQVQFIMAHMGGYGNWYVPMQGIALAKQYPNVWVETSQVTVKFIERAVKELGAAGPGGLIPGMSGLPSLSMKGSSRTASIKDKFKKRRK